MQELASLALAVDTSQMVKAIEMMDKASLSADKLSEANVRLAKTGAEGSDRAKKYASDYEAWWGKALVKQEENLGRQTLAIQKNTEAYDRLKASAEKASMAGIRSPHAVAEELAGLSRARDMWNEAGKAAQGYDGALAQITARESTLIDGNARHRGALRQTAAAMASLAFEAGGAAFLITAVGGALAAPIMPGVGLSKAIEDTRLGMASILISMGRINGIAPTLPQALQISGGMMDKLVNDSMRFGVSIEALANTLRATLAPGLAAGMNLEQIQKVATIGTIAVKTIGLDSRQTVQEIRDLVAGGIQASSSTLATSLGIKDSDIKRWREAGTLYDELMNKMQGFQIAAGENANTLSGSWDILQTKFALLMTSEEGFTAIKDTVKSISEYIGHFDKDLNRMVFNPALVAEAKAYWDTIIGIGAAIGSVASIVAEISWPIQKLAQFVSLAATELKLLFGAITTGFKEVAIIAKVAFTGDFEGATKELKKLDAEWQKTSGALAQSLGKTGIEFFGLGEDAKKATVVVTNSLGDRVRAASVSAQAEWKMIAEKYEHTEAHIRKREEERTKIVEASYKEQVRLASENLAIRMRLDIFEQMKERVGNAPDRLEQIKIITQAEKRYLDSVTQNSKAIIAQKEQEQIALRDFDAKGQPKGKTGKTWLETMQADMVAHTEATNVQLSNVEKLDKAMSLNTDKRVTEAKYLATLRVAQAADTEAASKALDKASSKELDDLDKKLAAQRKHNDEIGKTPEQIANVAAAVEQLAIKELELYSERLKDAARLDVMSAAQADLYRREANAIDAQIAKRKELAGGDVIAAEREKALEVTKAQDKANKEMWTKVNDYAHSAFMNITDKGKNAFAEIGAALKRSVLDMLYQMTIQKWIFNIGATATGVGAAGVASAATGGGSDILGSASNLLSGAVDWGGLIGGSMGTFGTGIASAMSTGIVSGFTNGMAAVGMGQTAAGLGMMLPGIGAAIGAISLLGGLFGSDGPSNVPIGAISSGYSASGKATGADSPWAAGQSMTAAMQSSYANMASSLGIGLAAQQWNFSQNQQGENKYFRIASGNTGYQSASGPSGQAAQTDEAMRLAASQAVFSALQHSQLPIYLAKIFRGVDAASISQQQIDSIVAFAGSVKQMRETLLETRTPVEILTQQVLDGQKAFKTTAATFKTDFVAVIDKGINPKTFDAWKLLGQRIDQLAAIDAQKAADVLKAAADLSKQRMQLEIQIMELSGNAVGALAAKRKIEMDALDSSLQPLQATIYLLQDQKAAAEVAAAALQKQVDATKALADANIAKSISDYQAALQAVDAQRTFAAGLRTFIQSISAGGIGAQFGATNAAARAGNLVAQGALTGSATAYLESAKLTSASAVDYAREVAFVQNSLSDTALFVEKNATIADKQLEQLRLANVWLSSLDAKNSTQNQSLDYLLSAAIVSSQAAQQAVADQQKAVAAQTTAATTAVSTAATPQINTSAMLQKAINPNQAQIDSYETQLASWKPYVSTHPNMVRTQETSSYFNLRDAITALGGVPSFAVGTNFLPSDMLIQAHEGERIIPKADNAQLMQRLQDPQANNEALVIEIRALRDEVRQLRENNTAENIAVISATQKTAKITDRWDGDGMPDIRTTGATA